MVVLSLWVWVFAWQFGNSVRAQVARTDSISSEFDLANCISYALNHVPDLQQRKLDFLITNSQVSNQLANYFPQLNLQADYQHTIQRRRSIIGNQNIFFGPKNNNNYELNLQQAIFNADLYHNLVTASPTRELAKQTISEARVRVIVQVSNAFYDVLYSMEQIRVLQGDLVRLERSLQDANNRYKSGTTDNSDYLRAQISLNTKQVALKQAENNLRSGYALLKNAMGMPIATPLRLRYDFLFLEQQATEIPKQEPQTEERVEYQKLLLKRQIAQQNILFNKINFLPSLSANAGYTLIFQETNNNLKTMYDNTIPYSYIGLQLNWSLFQGMKKSRNLQQAKWNFMRTQWDLQQFRNTQNAEYTRAMAQYNSDLASYQVLHDNLQLSQQVYDNVRNQYMAGVKTYLEVVIAESELSELRALYAAALFQLLKDKVEVDRTLGKIK